MTSDGFDFTLRGVLSAALTTVRDPKGGATDVLQARLPLDALWTLLVAVVAVSVVLGQGSLMLANGELMGANAYLANPMLMWAIQLGLLVVMVYAIHHIGRAMGGGGAFEGALAMVVWLQVVMACVQVLQTLALFLAPPLSDILGIVGLVLFLWLLTNFVAVLHGFESLGLVFVMILMSAFGITFILSLILAMVGLGVPGDGNV